MLWLYTLSLLEESKYSVYVIFFTWIFWLPCLGLMRVESLRMFIFWREYCVWIILQVPVSWVIFLLDYILLIVLFFFLVLPHNRAIPCLFRVAVPMITLLSIRCPPFSCDLLWVFKCERQHFYYVHEIIFPWRSYFFFCHPQFAFSSRVHPGTKYVKFFFILLVLFLSQVEQIYNVVSFASFPTCSCSADVTCC